LGPAENAAVLTGARKRLEADRVMQLRGAWHVAAWNTAAKVGKLKPWAEYHRELTATSTPAPAAKAGSSWQARKAERQHQMDLLKKHQAQRTTVRRRPRG
jgi:hypothetical protein